MEGALVMKKIFFSIGMLALAGFLVLSQGNTLLLAAENMGTESMMKDESGMIKKQETMMKDTGTMKEQGAMMKESGTMK